MATKFRSFPSPFSDYEFGFNFGTQFDAVKGKMLNLIELILNNQPIDNESCDGGLYCGLGGIPYMFVHLIRTPDVLTQSEKVKMIPRVQKFLNAQLNYYSKLRDLASQSTDEDDDDDEGLSHRVGLLVGESGIFAVGAVLGHLLGNEKLKIQCIQEFVQAAEIAAQPHDFDGKGSNDICTGRAGYLCAALWLNQYLGYQPVPLEVLYAIWEAILCSGRAEAKKKKIKHYPLSFSYQDEDFVGSLHGASSILYALLSWPQFLERNTQAEKDIRATVDYLVQIFTEFQTGYFPATMKEVAELRMTKKKSDTPEVPSEVYPLQWCHGMPGLAYLLAKVGIRYKNHEYLKCCLKIANTVWAHGLTTKGIGLCHGIAGNAYLFLLVYRLTECDARFLYRAVRFAEFMFSEECQEKSQSPENPYSLFEGLAGTVCFLSDLLRPQQSEFPFFNVFYDPTELPTVAPLVVAMVPSAPLSSPPLPIQPKNHHNRRHSKKSPVSAEPQSIRSEDPRLPVSILLPNMMMTSRNGTSSKRKSSKKKMKKSKMGELLEEETMTITPEINIKLEYDSEEDDDELMGDGMFNVEDILQVSLEENVQVKTERISPVEEILS